MTSHPPSLAREIDAALAFWRAAGVDCGFADDARAWLTDPAPTPASAAAALPGKIPADDPAREMRANSGDRPEQAAASPSRRDFWGDSPPASLEEFRNWWLTSPDLGRGSYPRIAPRGPAGARLMVLVPDPEVDDQSELLSGPQGRLLARIITAMGLAADECYLASALPRHTPMADLASLAAGGLDRVTAHHITLAAPQRLVVFGQGCSAFLPTSPTPENQPLREINHNRLSSPVMITETLESMLHMPKLKARFWRKWMEWSA